MKSLLRIGLWMVVLTMLTTTGWAGDRSILVQGGWLHTPNSNYGDSGELVLRAETQVYQAICLGIEYSYHGPTSIFPENGPEYGSFDGHSALLEAILRYPLGKASIYLLGGAGPSWWAFNRSSDTQQRGIEVDTKGASLAVKYAVGADWPIDSHWSLNIEWSYFETDIHKAAHYTDGSFSNILDTGSTLGHAETSLVAGVKYKW